MTTFAFATCRQRVSVWPTDTTRVALSLGWNYPGGWTRSFAATASGQADAHGPYRRLGRAEDDTSRQRLRFALMHVEKAIKTTEKVFVQVTSVGHARFLSTPMRAASCVTPG
jgi:hypothetical protein